MSVAGSALAIETRGLTKRYGPVLALDRLDLAIPAGTVYGVLGPNGAGKTTALRLLAGLARPTEGTASVAGRVGALAQDPRFYGWLTGREFLELTLSLDPEGRTLDGGARRARIDETLEVAGLTEAAGRRIGGYSGGMRQRIGLAAALVGRPAVLLLDEPVSSLDPAGRHDLLATIAGLRERATVLFSTHILADVERVCDRVGILDHGRLIAEGPLPALIERFAGDAYRIVVEPGGEAALAGVATRTRAAAWAREVELAGGDREGTGGTLVVRVTDVEPAGAELLRLAADAALPIVSLERVRPTLEEVFLRVTEAAR